MLLSLLILCPPLGFSQLPCVMQRIPAAGRESPRLGGGQLGAVTGRELKGMVTLEPDEPTVAQPGAPHTSKLPSKAQTLRVCAA